MESLFQAGDRVQMIVGAQTFTGAIKTSDERYSKVRWDHPALAYANGLDDLVLTSTLEPEATT